LACPIGGPNGEGQEGKVFHHASFASPMLLLSDSPNSKYDSVTALCNENEPDIRRRPIANLSRNKSMKLIYLFSAGSRKFQRFAALSALLIAPTIVGASPLQIIPGEQLNGDFTLQQQSSERYMDAHENSNDNSVVTRAGQKK
jgi:hypothetical protein